MTQKHPWVSSIPIRPFATTIRHHGSLEVRRSSGQGLLLAVLVMLLVALLGATFVGVISFNLAQAARHEDTVRAEAMARGGIQYADEQLTNSMEGPSWRPSDHFGGSAAASTRAGDLGYYDEIERARGWNDGKYVKYPDPYDPNAASISNPDFGGGRFLLKVEYPGGAAGSDTEKFIKITSIGRSSNNPAVFKERVAYKPVSLVDNLLFVTHKRDSDGTPDTTQTAVLGTAPQINFDAETMLKEAVAANTTDTIKVFNKGAFTSADETVANLLIVGDGAKRETATIAAGGITPTGDDGYMIKLTVNLQNAHPANSPVQKSTTNVTDSDRVYSIFDGPIFINGMLKWFGHCKVNLTSPTNPNPDLRRKDTVQVAGTISADSDYLTADPRRVYLTKDDTTPGNVDDDTPVEIAGTTGATDIEDSTSFTSISSGGVAYQDAWGRLNNDHSFPDRWVRPIKAPVFVTGDVSNSASPVTWIRYADLTRYSNNTKLASGSSRTRGDAGFGLGIYVDNSSDIQYATSSVATRLTSLVADWKDTTGTDSDNDTSHGWVNHLEYVPTGVEIVLRNDDVEAGGGGSLGTNTKHSVNKALHTNGRPVVWMKRDDTSTSPWYRYDNGAALSAATTWVSFDYPQNGVILAEGNVRIRGNLPKSTTTNRYDLTIVSGGTTYIEGSILTPTDRGEILAAGERNSHVALLAKDHVCVNTTQFHHRTIDDTNVGPADSTDNAPKVLGTAADNKGNDSRWLVSSAADDLQRNITLGATSGTPRLTVRYGGVMKIGYVGGNATIQVTGTAANPLLSGTGTDSFTNLDLTSNNNPNVRNIDDTGDTDGDGITDGLRNWLKYRGWDSPDSVAAASTKSDGLALLGTAVDVRYWYFWMPLQTRLDLTVGGVRVRDEAGAAIGSDVFRDSFPRRYATYQFPSTPAIGSETAILFDRKGSADDFRLTRFKLEQFDSGGQPRQGMDIIISALLYAQDGTFFIMPGVYFDDSSKTSTGYYDGAVRFRRYNYHVQIRGAVAQNYTADEGAGPPTDAYQLNSTLWTDKWSYPAWNGTRYDWTGIEYQYDPELRTSSGGTLVLPYLPVAEGLVFEG